MSVEAGKVSTLTLTGSVTVLAGSVMSFVRKLVIGASGGAVVVVASVRVTVTADRV